LFGGVEIGQIARFVGRDDREHVGVLIADVLRERVVALTGRADNLVSLEKIDIEVGFSELERTTRVVDSTEFIEQKVNVTFVPVFLPGFVIFGIKVEAGVERDGVEVRVGLGAMMIHEIE
jgi:hypothetical protein